MTFKFTPRDGKTKKKPTEDKQHQADSFDMNKDEGPRFPHPKTPEESRFAQTIRDNWKHKP